MSNETEDKHQSSTHAATGGFPRAGVQTSKTPDMDPPLRRIEPEHSGAGTGEVPLSEKTKQEMEAGRKSVAATAGATTVRGTTDRDTEVARAKAKADADARAKAKAEADLAAARAKANQ